MASYYIVLYCVWISSQKAKSSVVSISPQIIKIIKTNIHILHPPESLPLSAVQNTTSAPR
jgi:hypothetical protein